MSGREGAPSQGGKSESRYNLLTSLVLVSPLFLIYQIGVLITWPLYNGADLITRLLIEKSNLIGYLAINVGAVAILVSIAGSRKGKDTVRPAQFVPLLLESAFYAFFLGSAIIFVMARLLRMAPPQMGGVLGNFIMSAGAGVHEELLFRLLLMNGLVMLFEGLKFGKLESFLSALVFSSTLFSAIHHLGPLGDPWSLWVFTFRLLAGIVFGVIYWYRGFAVAVYTHALYDMYVLIFRG
ncbi:MAG: CPBP family intramembrane metalloprotease [Candidatus Brocadiae bacterium]|nr:CPBP family intramembrane metalloprotease [Candidatus Brocadiia bacterium]